MGSSAPESQRFRGLASMEILRSSFTRLMTAIGSLPECPDLGNEPQIAAIRCPSRIVSAPRRKRAADRWLGFSRQMRAHHLRQSRDSARYSRSCCGDEKQAKLFCPRRRIIQLFVMLTQASWTQNRPNPLDLCRRTPGFCCVPHRLCAGLRSKSGLSARRPDGFGRRQVA